MSKRSSFAASVYNGSVVKEKAQLSHRNCSMLRVITGRPAPVFTQWSKNGFFTPQGRLVAPINVKFDVSRLSGQKCGNTASKTVKVSNFGQKFVPQCDASRLQYFFNEILSVCTLISF